MEEVTEDEMQDDCKESKGRDAGFYGESRTWLRGSRHW